MTAVAEKLPVETILTKGRRSATADLGSLAKLGRQCAGYLPFSRNRVEGQLADQLN